MSTIREEVTTIDITAAEAARRLDVSTSTITRRAAAGVIPGAWQDEYSGSWHIPEESIRTEAETEAEADIVK
jgi:predicted site-specific integrase-resolvase